jgi:O-antigen/teichoic acid export membrane protein
MTFRITHLTWRHFKDTAKFGAGIHSATLLIVAREPVLKTLIARASDLASVASFEIVYRLCTQLASIVITPLLGTFSASALLARERADELGLLLRTMLGFCLATFVPLVLFFATFSVPLVELWLGPGYDNVSAMLPGVFTAFAVYFSSEVMYKAIEGSGRPGYSALIQAATFIVMLGIFYFYPTSVEQAVPAALLGAFLFFSVVNLIVFRLRFPTLRLCTLRQLAWLAGPALAYTVALRWSTPEDVPAAFLIYTVVHVWCVRHAGVFDVFGMARRLLNIVAAKP